MAHVWLGLALLAQGQYVEAADRNLHVYRLDPLAPIVVTNAGFDALRFGRDDEARERFTAAMELDPLFPVPRSGMSRLCMTRGDVEGGLQWIERAIEIAPTRAFYRARKALLALQLGDLATARAANEEAHARAAEPLFNAELVIALHMALRESAALEAIVAGHAGPAFTPRLRACAAVALGRIDEARALYDTEPGAFAVEVDELLNDDWVWRMPHTVTRAHLLLATGGRERGVSELEAFLARTDGLFESGIVSGDLHYWSATACLLLEREEAGIAHLEVAVEVGWRHGWWAELDWNLQGWREHPRVAAALVRARPVRSRAVATSHS